MEHFWYVILCRMQFSIVRAIDLNAVILLRLSLTHIIMTTYTHTGDMRFGLSDMQRWLNVCECIETRYITLWLPYVQSECLFGGTPSILSTFERGLFIGYCVLCVQVRNKIIIAGIYLQFAHSTAAHFTQRAPNRCISFHGTFFLTFFVSLLHFIEQQQQQQQIAVNHRIAMKRASGLRKKCIRRAPEIPTLSI